MAERLSVKDLYRIVHDIKTPVNTITGRLQMALKRIEEEKASRNVIQAVSGAYNLLRKFYNLYDLVALSENSEYPDRGPSDLGEAWALSTRKWSLLADSLSATVAGGVPPGLSVAVRKDVLTRLFDNLLSNALLHSDGCSMITLRTDRVRDFAKVMLRNDGYGGKKGALEIAEPDFSEGMSINHLGLPAVRGLVERLGGTFTARGTAGGAFIVSLTLPAGE